MVTYKFITLPELWLLIIAVIISCNNDTSHKKIQELYKGNKPIRPLTFYTEENPREWVKIAHEHVPMYRKSSLRGKPALLIEVPLKKPSIEHYIEKIGLLDESGKEIAVVEIKREPNPKTYAYFNMDIVPINGKGKVFVKCNLHDVWVKIIKFE